MIMIKILLKKSRLSVALGVISTCAILHSGDAKAVLVYELINEGSDVRVKLSGSLSGLSSGNITSLNFSSMIQPERARIVFSTTGSFSGQSYAMVGPTNFGTGGVVNMSSFSTSTDLALNRFTFALSNSYVQGTPITASGLITGQSLSTLGLNSTSGLLGIWTVGSDSIELWAGSKPGASSAAAPGPLPLLGAGTAFGYSRRLRSRLRGSRPSLKA